jgi:glycosyltransferase involved in cell wall biosynthesis
MRIIFDASNHTMYPIGADGFTSGTVVMVRSIAAGLADRGHTVHVITPDLEEEEQRGPTLWYWSKEAHPIIADAACQLMNVNPNAEYNAKTLLLMTFGLDPFLGPDHQWAAQVDGFPLLSEKHGELLRKARPTIEERKCFVTGLGVNIDEYGGPWLATVHHKKDEDVWIEGPVYDPQGKVPGRLLYANDPVRGLLPLLDIFDKVKLEVPEATLHIAYDFDRNLQGHAWEHSYQAQMLWECKRRIETTSGIVSLGALTREEIIREQLACQVHCMPSTAERDQLHGLTQLECAAAGCALVLSDVAAFPEVFGEGATILPVVGKFMPEVERRCTADDWAATVIRLMQDDATWQSESKRARALAEQHTWPACIDKWEAMLEQLKEGRNA